MKLNTHPSGVRAALPLTPVAAACAVLISALAAPLHAETNGAPQATDAPMSTVVV